MFDKRMPTAGRKRRLIACIALLGALVVTAAAAAYPTGQCTWWAHQKRPDLPGNLGNAKTWNENAARAGFPVSRTPRAGDVAVWEAYTRSAGGYGHVAYVERVNPNGTIAISEYNWPTGAGLRTRTMSPSGLSFIHRKGGTPPPPAQGFTNIRAYSSDTVAARAGDKVAIDVVAHYNGPPLECGWVNLRVRGDGQVPGQYIDSSNGYWRSPGGVAIAGCIGQLRDGQDARFHVPLKVPADQRPGVVRLPAMSPVYDAPPGRGGFWSGATVSLGLDVKSFWSGLKLVGQYITPQAAPGSTQRVALTFRNDTGREITPAMRLNFATGGPTMPNDTPLAGRFNRLTLAEPCAPGSQCVWSGSGTVPDNASPSRRRVDFHAVVDNPAGGYHDSWEATGGIWLIEKVGTPPTSMAPGLAEVDSRWAGQQLVQARAGQRAVGSITLSLSGWGCVATSGPNGFHLGIPGDPGASLLDRSDPRVLSSNRVAVPATRHGMVCSGDTVTVPVPVQVPANASAGQTLRVPLSAVTEGVEWDPTMAAQQVWLPVEVIG